MKITKTNLTKNDMKHLPNINGDKYKEQCAYYTELVFTKMDKIEAFKQSFPERYQTAIDNANGNNGLINANVTKEINKLERNKFVQECFYSANKHWWIKFLGKKQDIYEKLYETALDDNERTSDRLNASKIFLSYIPDAPKDDKITIEVKVGSTEFKDMLLEKKRELYNAANSEDIIEGEIDEHMSS